MPDDVCRDRRQRAITDRGWATRSKKRSRAVARRVLVGKGADRVLMPVIEKHAGNSLQAFPQQFKLSRCLWADENTSALTHGIPHVAAVLGDAARHAVGNTIVLHFGCRARRVQRHRKIVSAKQ
jgi:hypothetical protein